MNEYLLSLLFSINGTAQFIAIFALLGFAVCWLFHALEADIPKPPRWLFIAGVVAMLVATVTPDYKQYLAATVVVRGPEFTEKLIKALDNE